MLENIYIIHYSKLTERKESIKKYFDKEYLNLNFIEKYDQENIISRKDLPKKYVPDKVLYNEKVKLWGQNAVSFNELNNAEISCEMKHLEALNMISSSNKDFGLILEDDVIPTDMEFEKIINNIINKNIDWDVLFLGTGIGENFIKSKISIYDKILKRNIVTPTHPATNCAEAYLIKKDAAANIYKNIQEFNMAWDWELAYSFKELSMNIKWYIPPLFYQGSVSGEFKSALR